MRKTLSLMLSAALAVGSVATSHAAPLAKKVRSDSQTAKGFALAAAPAPVSDNAGRPKFTVPSTFTTKTPIKGLHKVESSIKAQNSRAVKSATAARRALAANVNLCGTMIHANSWQSYDYGLYTIPASGIDFEEIASFSQNYNSGAIDNLEGRFYGVNYTDIGGYYDFVSIDTYDTETWEQLSHASAGYDVMAQDVAIDPTTGEIYGVFSTADKSGWNWAKADYANVTHTPIAPCDVYFMSIGADNDGQFYGVGTDKVLYKINKTNGELTAVANVDIPYTDYYQGGCVNPTNHTYIQTYCTEGDAGMYEIDLTTGECTLITTFPDNNEFVGLYVAKSIAEDKAPSAPELQVTCENGAMDVQVSLTIPSTLFDGTPVSGVSFSYQVFADGETILEGTAEAGAVINESVTLTKTGITSFVATASNSVGSSPKAKASCFVGQGAPSAPTNVKLTWADDIATLTWDGITASADGGYLNPADVTYTIFDKDNNELATQSETTYTVSAPLSTVGLLQYSVKANYAGKSSETVASNSLFVGELSAPLVMDLTQIDNFAIHSTFDANDDGKTWGFNLGACYGYSSLNAADDWLFTPSIRLEAGNAYKITASTRSHTANYPERIEIFIGNGATSEAMSTTLVPATDIASDEPTEIGDYFIPETSGVYNIGFHAISDANQWNLYLLSYEISDPIDVNLPGVVEDATVTPDAEGFLKADISFKAPSKTVSGAALTGDVKVTVLRGQTLVKETVVGAGQTHSFVDSDIEEMGTYTYTFISASTDGKESQSTSVSAFIGPKTPSDIDTNTVSLSETAPGTFQLNWDAVTTATDGSAINPANISYRIYTIIETSDGLALGEEVATVTETSYTYVTDPSEQQDFFYLGVQPYNLTAGAENIAVGSTIAGTPYEMPVQYTNSASLDEYFLLYGGDGKLNIYTDASFQGVYAQDDDQEYFGIKHSYINDATYIQTGKINISGQNPVFSFYILNLTGFGDIEDTNTNVVSVIADGQETELMTINNAELENGEWNKVKVSLDAYSGKTVQIRLKAICNGVAYHLYDNFKISNDLNYDVAAKIYAPVEVETDAEFDVTVKVSNEGSEDTDALTVNLFRNDELVETTSYPYGLAADESETFTFKQTIGLTDGESAQYKATVVYEADENPANNETKTVTVARKIAQFPIVTGLTGEASEEGNSLTWDAIVIGDPVPTDVTEDFENGEPFAMEFEDWTFVDVDNSPVGTFSSFDIPGIIAGTTTASFFVFDASEAGYTFAAHSGNKYLASLYRSDSGTIDDWAISPLLPGEAQTISFFARSFSNSYREKIEIWYSTSDNSVESFTQLEAFGTQSPSIDWTEYSAELPAGTRYFAIRSCATDAFMLLVDDVTFTKLDGFDGKLIGYNLYCDGVKVNETPLTEPNFLHKAEDGVHTYHVTAIYDKGESELSEPLTLQTSAIDAVIAAGLKVAVEGQTIVVTGADDSLVTINAIDGKTIYSAHGDTRVAVATAIYLVTVDNKTFKVIVK